MPPDRHRPGTDPRSGGFAILTAGRTVGPARALRPRRFVRAQEAPAGPARSRSGRRAWKPQSVLSVSRWGHARAGPGLDPPEPPSTGGATQPTPRGGGRVRERLG